MFDLSNIIDAVYSGIGLLFAAGAGAMMLMFALMQIVARIAIWIDVVGAFRDRAELQAEVIRLKAAFDTLASGQPDVNVPLVTAIKVSDLKDRNTSGN